MIYMGVLLLKNENANINELSPMGAMLKRGSESYKKYVLDKVLPKDIAKAHRRGDIHIHDMDFYMLTETCCQIDLRKLFHGGFHTGHGAIREPKHIRSYASLACIALQCNQNDMHGGQAIPAFDYDMAEGVDKTYRKHLLRRMKETGDSKKAKELAMSYTENETYQAMEALIHNLNTMHSRAGAQVPFTSLNYGTDTSWQGRMVIRCLLKATQAGLGDGETPIFPIQIFKVKDGVNLNPGDPNYDLFQLAIETTAKRMFPNFSFMDAPFNAQYRPEEVAYMGCRTRVIGNVAGPEVTAGRGNLSFTSINLPAIALSGGNFWQRLEDVMELVHRQLLHRFKIQSRQHVYNYPFLMGQGIWLDSDKLEPSSTVGEVLRHGTLSVGFIGLAETLKALTGYHHGESKRSQALGLRIIKYMRQICDNWSRQGRLNYSLLATPAEGLSGRFVRLDKERYGIIEGVTDRDYYTNSFHVPVYYPIDAVSKITLEAPYHALTNAGHITYVEMDGDATHNLKAIENIVRIMWSKGIGYGSINHPVDRCPECGYTGVIDDVCPKCGHDEKNRILKKVVKR